MTRLPEPYAGRVDRYADATQKALSALEPVELLARLIQVERYDAQIRATSGDLARGYAELSTKVLKALPAATLANRITKLQATARTADGPTAASCFREITELKAANPQPSAEAVAEARRRIAAHRSAQPVRPAQAGRSRAGASNRSAAGSQVKAAVDRAVQAATAARAAEIARLEGELRDLTAKRARDEAAAASSTMLFKGAGAGGPARAAEVAELRRKAYATDDRMLRDGYLARAAELEKL